MDANEAEPAVADADAALLRGALDAAGQGLLVFDADRSLRAWNREVARLSPGLAADLFKGLSLGDVCALLAGFSADPEATRRLLHLGVDPAGPAVHLPLVDGTVLEIACRASTASGHVLVLTDATDSTARAGREMHLLSMVDLMPVALAVLDAHGRLVMWNDVYSSLCRNVPLEAGMPLGQLLHRFESARSAWKDEAATEDFVTERLRRHHEYSGPFEEWMGPDTCVLTSEHPIGGGGTLVIHTDISRQKLAEREMAQARRMAEQSAAAKTAFLANVSHELRTPLNAIIGFTDLILGETLGPVGNARYLDYLRDVRDSGTHLLDIINTILDITRIDAGALTLNEVKLEPEREIRAVARQLSPLAVRRNLKLELDLPDRGLVLKADNRSLRQMITNLLSNAIKFTVAGGTIRVSTRLIPAGGYAIAVEDTGIGIAADDLVRVMEPFGQVIEAQEHAPMTGTGLGLPLVRSLMELHGGSFTLSSDLGKGTRALLLFPAERIVKIDA
jgi:signal transduction histidine kinase